MGDYVDQFGQEQNLTPGGLRKVDKSFAPEIFNPACCKCGSPDISVRYHRGEQDCSYDERINHKSSRQDEHLHLTCRRCGFIWMNDTYDNSIKRKIKSP